MLACARNSASIHDAQVLDLVWEKMSLENQLLPEVTSTDAAEADQIDVIGFLEVLARKTRLLVVGMLVALIGALIFCIFGPQWYRATARIVTPQQQQSMASAALSQLLPLAGIVGGIKNPSDIYIGLLKTRVVLDRLVDKFKLMDAYDVKYREYARDELADNTKISSGKDGLISIRVTHSSPDVAAKIANAYVEELSEITKYLAITEAQQRRFFFEKRLEGVRKDLAKAESLLGNSGVNARILKTEPGAMARSLANIEASITAKQVQLASMKGYVTESSPEYKRALGELDALREQLAKGERNVSGESQTEYMKLFRNYKYQEALYEQLARQYELARIDESREGVLVQIVDEAQPPEYASWPRKRIVVPLSVTLTLLVLIGYIYFVNWCRRIVGSRANGERFAGIKRAVRDAIVPARR